MCVRACVHVYACVFSVLFHFTVQCRKTNPCNLYKDVKATDTGWIVYHHRPYWAHALNTYRGEKTTTWKHLISLSYTFQLHVWASRLSYTLSNMSAWATSLSYTSQFKGAVISQGLKLIWVWRVLSSAKDSSLPGFKGCCHQPRTHVYLGLKGAVISQRLKPTWG